MPRVVRVGGRSGVLPKPRQVVPPLRARFEEEEYQKLKSSFEDPSMAPRGSPANPPDRKERSVGQRIAHSAKKPLEQTTGNTKLTETQAWKSHIAQVRRAYFADTLKAYERAEKSAATARQRRHEATLQEHAASTELKDSAATVLTMPTIDSSLQKGAMVEPRSAEELEALRLKRQENRLQTEYAQRERQDNQLLELYHSAQSFIITVEELSREVDKQFGGATPHRPDLISHLRDHMVVINVDQGVRDAQRREQDRRIQLVTDALTGTLGGAPGLNEIRDALAGAEQDNEKE